MKKRNHSSVWTAVAVAMALAVISYYPENHGGSGPSHGEKAPDSSPDFPAHDASTPDSSTPEQELEAKELGEIISDWLLQLPEQQKKLFVRRYWFGDSLEQLSREFELPKGLISQRLSRMRGKLKVYLEQQGVSL